MNEQLRIDVLIRLGEAEDLVRGALTIMHGNVTVDDDRDFVDSYNVRTPILNRTEIIRELCKGILNEFDECSSQEHLHSFAGKYYKDPQNLYSHESINKIREARQG